MQRTRTEISLNAIVAAAMVALVLYVVFSPSIETINGAPAFQFNVDPGIGFIRPA